MSSFAKKSDELLSKVAGQNDKVGAAFHLFLAVFDNLENKVVPFVT